MRDESRLYAVYRGDQFVDVGAFSELCERHGWKRKTLSAMATPKRVRRAEENGRTLFAFALEED